MDHSEHDAVVGSLRRAMHEAGDEELYGWMRVRFAGFRALLAESRRPDWKRIAAGLAKLGVLDGRGNPPSAATARQTWWKVRRDVAAVTDESSLANTAREVTPHAASRDPKSPGERPLSHVVVGPQGAFDPDDIAADAIAQPEFRPATPRNWSPPPQPSGALPTAPAVPKQGQDYETVLRALTERARARALPMPQIPTAEDE